MIELKDISYKASNNSFFSKDEKIILSNISFNIPIGKILGIIGESGAGKTTLAKIIAGIISPSAGSINYNSFSINNVQILFQNSIELINPNRKVKSLLLDTIVGSETEIANQIKKVQLDESILEKFAYQLSGGERQRIALARILAINPKVLIIDEPFSAQDYKSQINLMNLFNELNANTGLTIVCVSHDLGIMKMFSDNLIVMKNGEIVENGKTEEVVKKPKDNYTKKIFKAAEFKVGSSTEL
jgi:ABC-type dipeptide/oligopeptide/nickel transport system ATPase subunit